MKLVGFGPLILKEEDGSNSITQPLSVALRARHLPTALAANPSHSSRRCYICGAFSDCLRRGVRRPLPAGTSEKRPKANSNIAQKEGSGPNSGPQPVWALASFLRAPLRAAVHLNGCNTMVHRVVFIDSRQSGAFAPHVHEVR